MPDRDGVPWLVAEALDLLAIAVEVGRLGSRVVEIRDRSRPITATPLARASADQSSRPRRPCLLLISSRRTVATLFPGDRMRDSS